MRIRRLAAVAARAEFADVLDDAQHRNTATIIERHGRAAAIVLPLTWYRSRRGADDPPADESSLTRNAL